MVYALHNCRKNGNIKVKIFKTVTNKGYVYKKSQKITRKYLIIQLMPSKCAAVKIALR